MKNGIILCKTTSWSSRLDVEYLDETSEVKYDQQQKLKTGIGRQLHQFANYASKEELGQVYAGGYFHFLVCTNDDGSMAGQKSLSNDERKLRIVKAWSKQLSTYPTANVVQKRLVFSMSKEFYDRLVQCGINPDYVLIRNTQEVLRALQERFHKGDSIGYAYGLHHDTEHLHIHVALCPRTRNGAYVGLSKPRISSAVSGHRDQHGFLIQQFERINKKWEEALADPVKLWKKLQQNPLNERLLFSPHLTQAEIHKLLNSRNTVASQLATEYRRICALQMRINEKRAAIAARKNTRTALRLSGIRTGSSARHQKLQQEDIEQLKALTSELRTLKRQYFFKHQRFYKTYATAHARPQTKRISQTRNQRY